MAGTDLFACQARIRRKPYGVQEFATQQVDKSALSTGCQKRCNTSVKRSCPYKSTRGDRFTNVFLRF